MTDTMNYLVFDVHPGGTLMIADYREAETREDFYGDSCDGWDDSSEHLSWIIVECQPLSWAVESLYSDKREELQVQLHEELSSGNSDPDRAEALRSCLSEMPEEPSEGVVPWLLRMSQSEFRSSIVPAIERWFNEAPDWNWEDDYLPAVGTAQGAALAFFRDMPYEDLDLIGVQIVEGDRPGSTYYAAELKRDLAQANRAAEAAGLAVRFQAKA